MKRWDRKQMLDIGRQLFAKIHKRKYHAHHNHEIHFMAREINDWLPQGIKSMQDGTYNLHHLRRYYFKDKAVDQVHPSDRILQHILLKQLKPTFQHVMNPNCYHLHGPSGVKLASQRIRQVLQEQIPNFIIRADIKSFYKSIPHFKLIQDIKKYYDDIKVQTMLENIITNAIEAPRGCRNPVTGITLRGPLSQFFSGIYLKPLDDAFNGMNVTYLRYQDDILILCKTKRQLNRCKRRMMEVLRERRLSLSRKKTRMGCIESGFHFLGIDYPKTRPLDNTNAKHSSNDLVITSKAEHYLSVNGGGVVTSEQNELIGIVPHLRTLRKAREQVKYMVKDEVSPRKIRNYLHHFFLWWVNALVIWDYEELIKRFLSVCWDVTVANYATGLLARHLIKSHRRTRMQLDFVIVA